MTEDPRTPVWSLRRLLAAINDDEPSWHDVNAEIEEAGGCWSCVAHDTTWIATEILHDAGDDATAIAWVERRLAQHLELETIDPVADDQLPQWQEDPYPRSWLDDAPPPDDRDPPATAGIDTCVREVLRHAVRGEHEQYQARLRTLPADSREAFVRVYIEDLVAHQGQRLTEARLDGSIEAGRQRAAEENR